MFHTINREAHLRRRYRSLELIDQGPKLPVFQSTNTQEKSHEQLVVRCA
jgi:hypothetical protein